MRSAGDFASLDALRDIKVRRPRERHHLPRAVDVPGDGSGTARLRATLLGLEMDPPWQLGPVERVQPES
jgi:hypothetical protein